MVEKESEYLKKGKFNLKNIFTTFIIIILFSLGVFAVQQSHPLSQITPIDQNLDMGSYGINTHFLNVGGGYEDSGASIDSDGNIQTVGNLEFSGFTNLFNIMKINDSLEVDGSVTINGPLYFTSTNNVLNIAAAGSAATNNIYWGNKLLCDTTESDCGWFTEIEDIWVNKTGDTMTGTLNINSSRAGLRVLESEIGINATGSLYGGYFEGTGINEPTTEGVGVSSESDDYGVYGVYALDTSNYGYLGKKMTAALKLGVLGNGSITGVKGESLSKAVKGVNLDKSSTIGYLASNVGSDFYGVLGIGDYGVYGVHDSSGSIGYLADSEIGVYGESESIGVYGNGSLIGVAGFGDDTGYSGGVMGSGSLDADYSIGVMGLLDFVQDLPHFFVGVYGAYDSENYGYLGRVWGPDVIGLYGESSTSVGDAYGVYGNSSGYGVYGVGDIGVYGKYDDNNYGYIGSFASHENAVGYVQRGSDHYAQLAYYELDSGDIINIGARGVVDKNSTYNYGLYGRALNANILNYGVYGQGDDYGVYAEGITGIRGYGNLSGVAGFGGDTGYSGGVMGSGDLWGVLGIIESLETFSTSEFERGVLGAYNSSNFGYLGGVKTQMSYGVYGEGITGIYGEGYYGVYGNSSSGYGVYGSLLGSCQSPVSGTAVYGDGAVAGVYGEGEIGVKGFSEVDFAVVGEHDNGNIGYLGHWDYGVYGEHNEGHFGYLGSEDYAVYGEHAGFSGNKAHIGGEDYALYAINEDTGAWAYMGGMSGAIGRGIQIVGSSLGLYATTDGTFGIYTDRHLHSGDRVYIEDLPTTGGTLVGLSSINRLTKQSSSERYKTNISDYEIDFMNMYDVKLKSFIFKNSNISIIGYIAEDIEELGLKELVVYDSNNTVDAIRNSLIPIYLIEILKYQQERIENLDLELKKQDQDLENLKLEFEDIKLKKLNLNEYKIEVKDVERKY